MFPSPPFSFFFSFSVSSSCPGRCSRHISLLLLLSIVVSSFLFVFHTSACKQHVIFTFQVKPLLTFWSFVLCIKPKNNFTTSILASLFAPILYSPFSSNFSSSPYPSVSPFPQSPASFPCVFSFPITSSFVLILYSLI